MIVDVSFFAFKKKQKCPICTNINFLEKGMGKGEVWAVAGPTPVLTCAYLASITDENIDQSDTYCWC